MNICVFGGSFDPVHNGHINIAKKALDLFNFDKLIFMVSKEPPHKEKHKAEFYHRFNMVNIALKNQNNKKLESSDIENKLGSKSYTYYSLVELKKQFNNAEFYFLTGSDIFATIDEWYNWEQLFSLTNFVIGCRPGISFIDMVEKVPEIVRSKIELHDKIILFEYSGTIEISSSQIRKNISKYKDYLDSDVYSYIISNNLYKGE